VSTVIVTYATPDDLRGVLDRMNEAGVAPELAAVDATGLPFLATLGDSGDEAAFVVITANAEGWPTGRVACEECGSNGPTGWTPTYPVTTLGGAR
jgi:uncharacterized protein (DUF849 family)